jgi:hypothetical protein
MFRFICASLFSFFVASSAVAEGISPDRISLLLGSHHAATDVHFEEFNPGIFATWEDRGPGQLDYSIGAYRNSFGNLSKMYVVAKSFDIGRDAQIGVFAGVASYPQWSDHFIISFGEYVPVGGVQGRYKNAFMQVMPSDGKVVGSIISFGLTFDLD